MERALTFLNCSRKWLHIKVSGSSTTTFRDRSIASTVISPCVWAGAQALRTCPAARRRDLPMSGLPKPTRMRRHVPSCCLGRLPPV
eukprot:6727921-Pyramimonas_sp.AAC.1